MNFFQEMGELALASRLKAVSEGLYELGDGIYRARDSELKSRWFPIVRLLHDRGPLSVSEIAKEIGQTHSAVSQLADKLEQEGWIRALADDKDDRRRLLALTEKARAQIRDVKPIWKALKEVLLERCTQANIDLLDALGKFQSIIEDPTLAESVLQRAKHSDQASVRIVPFAPALSAHFYRLNEQWLRKFFYVEEIDHQVLSHPQEEILDHGGAILFALLGEEVVGTCALKQEKPRHYELTKMGVDERYQGLGIGRRLLEAAIEEFHRCKGQVLFLETNSRLKPALHLYESLGFKRQATIKPGSHYQRADVYMIWKASASSKDKQKKTPSRDRKK